MLGAAIGAVATVGVAIAQAISQQRAEAQRRRDDREATAAQKREEHEAATRAQRASLTRRYFFQLDDAVRSLENRLQNWRHYGGEQWSERVHPGYFISTLYALARALGADRILAIERDP